MKTIFSMIFFPSRIPEIDTKAHTHTYEIYVLQYKWPTRLYAFLICCDVCFGYYCKSVWHLTRIRERIKLRTDSFPNCMIRKRIPLSSLKWHICHNYPTTFFMLCYKLSKRETENDIHTTYHTGIPYSHILLVSSSVTKSQIWFPVPVSM